MFQSDIFLYSVIASTFLVCNLNAADFTLSLRNQTAIDSTKPEFERSIKNQSWKANETAFIVCDVWDYHHCINAVGRLEEFTPTMDKVLKQARAQGALIIHSPSDCMDAYKDNPARFRAIHSPKAKSAPANIESWCSRIPTEEKVLYPIDQSDGGEDDDPIEHKQWSAKLKALGRNPNMPWKAQSSMIQIDTEKDFISDKGDEVWNILEQKGIKNVVLLGVHTNMCVLGRPFGLRQMVRGGKNVVLMRDMTDCMYNPKQWPYVDHFTGNELIISHIERFVCSTITSDQIIGGKAFQFKNDSRKIKDVVTFSPSIKNEVDSIKKQWTTINLPPNDEITTVLQQSKVNWFRASVRIPTSWVNENGVALSLNLKDSNAKAWLNGNALSPPINKKDFNNPTYLLTPEFIYKDDINLLVIRVESTEVAKNLLPLATLMGKTKLVLTGSWQVRVGDDPTWSNIPLPAKFGLGSDLYYEPTGN